MSLTRRGVLGGLAVAGIGALAPAPRARADLAGPVSLRLRTYPVTDLGAANRVDGLYGRLRFLGGLELQASHDAFGGLSGVSIRDGGATMLAVSDNGYWVRAALERDADGRLVGAGEAVMAPLRGPNGDLLWRTGFYDSEALTIVGTDAYVGIEVAQAVFRYDLGAGLDGHGTRIPVPDAVSDLVDAWSGNKGLEALVVLDPPSPLAGALVAVAERARRGDDAPTEGVVLTGSSAGATFLVARSEGFEITDLETLPGGDLLVLERRYTLLDGTAARIRRIAATTIVPDATLDGPVIFRADWTNAIDNMEGLSARTGPGGETILTLISDDNYSILQRTLLLEFALVDPD